MCAFGGGGGGSYKAPPPPVPPPVPPPAPAPLATAKEVVMPELKKKQSASRVRGRSALVINSAEGMDYGTNLPA